MKTTRTPREQYSLLRFVCDALNRFTPGCRADMQGTGLRARVVGSVFDNGTGRRDELKLVLERGSAFAEYNLATIVALARLADPYALTAIVRDEVRRAPDVAELLRQRAEAVQRVDAAQTQERLALLTVAELDDKILQRTIEAAGGVYENTVETPR